jgi:NAD(P)H-hydrate epimerase
MVRFISEKNHSTQSVKILTAHQIRQADAYTIAHEPISSPELMERAATAAANALVKYLNNKNLQVNCLHFFCGRGNNGGDGLVMARLLSSQYEVAVWVCPVPNEPSADFTLNMRRLQQLSNVSVQWVQQIEQLPQLQPHDVCIDCIFGSGLNRPPEGLIAEIIHYLNQADARKVSVDMPSGLFADKPVLHPETVFRADYTITFEFPKRSFLYDNYYSLTGEWEAVPIGLHPDFLRRAETKIFRTDPETVKSYYQPRKKNAHKGNFGHGLIIAGSAGKMGAAILAAHAAIRSGIGLLTAAIPAVGLPMMQVAVPEAMCLTDIGNSIIHRLPEIDPYSSIGIGPGIGQDKMTVAAIDDLLKKNIHCPMVWDADALNLLAQNSRWWGRIPPGSILTPHPKEFERLAGISVNDFKRHEIQMMLSKKHSCLILLKGANTCITTPDGLTYFNSTGNPGMATGGSGDVLTGILTALLAQGYSPEKAAVMGAFLHGLAGDLAAADLSQEGMKAGDLIRYLPLAWRQISH